MFTRNFFCMKRYFLLASLLVFLLNARAQKPEVYQPAGKAIGGYDPVAFFTDGQAAPGADSLRWRWHEADWYFTTAAHRDSFQRQPERYAPQYGGWCAYGASKGYKAPTETATWTVYGDKLYFNYNQQVKTRWMEAKDTLISRADQHWAMIRNQ